MAADVTKRLWEMGDIVDVLRYRAYITILLAQLTAT
jgi:hypothetical protein